MVPFGVWASAMGLALGGLAHVTGGLTAPIVAHGVYDILALAYIRRGAQHA
jgi:membrane protease YdiL (CAAX protease family)